MRKFPLNTLKIDRSFISNVTDSADDRTIVRALIQMAHNLKLSVVAEGVETEDQLALLREERCDIVQGYVFGKPLPPEDFVKLLPLANAV